MKIATKATTTDWLEIERRVQVNSQTLCGNPKAIQADVLTFQLLSFSNSTNLCLQYFGNNSGGANIIERVQKAAYLIELSPSDRHFETGYRVIERDVSGVANIA